MKARGAALHGPNDHKVRQRPAGRGPLALYRGLGRARHPRGPLQSIHGRGHLVKPLAMGQRTQNGRRLSTAAGRLEGCAPSTVSVSQVYLYYDASVKSRSACRG